jgi:NAD(P)H-hydrate epimerase
MIGAPALAANAALRGGAGLATVACPRSIQLAVATLCPCATTLPLPENAAGMLDPKRTAKELHALGANGRAGQVRRPNLLDPATAPSVVAAGPGLGRGNETFDRAWLALLDAFGRAGVPVVLDADGLNALHRSADWTGPGWDEAARFRTVITPHPGEMARLHQTTTTTVQRDRTHFAVNTARKMSTARRDDPDHCAVVVLKGAGTIVTDGTRLYTNKTGNPGMATGGSGDVLTGLIAALIAQGMTCFDAAVLGVHLHALAGDLAAEDLGEISLTASDLIDTLPAAFKRMPR